jgi:hypothetical protein
MYTEILMYAYTEICAKRTRFWEKVMTDNEAQVKREDVVARGKQFYCARVRLVLPALRCTLAYLSRKQTEVLLGVGTYARQAQAHFPITYLNATFYIKGWLLKAMKAITTTA